MKRLYEITWTLSGQNIKPSFPLKNKNVSTISWKEKKTRCAEYYKGTIDESATSVSPELSLFKMLLDIDIAAYQE